jgi:signal transduction histidine kinase
LSTTLLPLLLVPVLLYWHRRLMRREAEQRLLARAGLALASSLDYRATVTRLAQLVVPALADLCIVELSDEDGHPPAQPMLLTRPTPEMLCRGEEQRRALRAVDIRSAISVPLLAHGELVGTLVLVSSTRLHRPSDLLLAKELALRAALAIDNSLKHRAALRVAQDREEMLGVVAHDLRTPLAAVMMNAALLRRESATLSVKIDRAAQRMNRLIQDLLDVTRMQAGRLMMRPSCVPTARMVWESVEAQRPAASAASLELHVEVPDDFPDLWVDSHRLLQVFENLIGNAVKFTPPGGAITVGVSLEGGLPVFRVADTGTGIRTQDLPHVFERFWQAPRSTRQGAGLGLTIAKGIVEAHGGNIWVESEPGHGSRFYFSVPAARPSELC